LQFAVSFCLLFECEAAQEFSLPTSGDKHDDRYSLTFWCACNSQNILDQKYCTLWTMSSIRIKGPKIIFAHIMLSALVTHQRLEPTPHELQTCEELFVDVHLNICLATN
jgi:hypothetical protein